MHSLDKYWMPCADMKIWSTFAQVIIRADSFKVREWNCIGKKLTVNSCMELKLQFVLYN